MKAFGAFAQLHVQEANGVIYSMGRKEIWVLGGILRAERNFSLSCDFSGGTN